MIFLTICDRTARSLAWQSTITVFVLLAAVPARVKPQTCPECTGQHIKTVDTTTGECIDCFPCPRCVDDYTSSVPCGTTVPDGTDITCVLIQSNPVVLSAASTQTRHLNSVPLSISSKFTASPATSIVHSIASSSASTRSSIAGIDGSDTIRNKKSEKELALAEWKKDSIIYIFCGTVLAVTLVAVVYRIRRKSRKQPQLPGVDRVRSDPSSPRQSPSDVLALDNETCSINCATNTVEFRRHNGCTSEIGDGNQRSQCFAAQGSSEVNSKPSDLVAAPVDVQLHSKSHSPVPLSRCLTKQDGTIAYDGEQGRPIIWSALSQTEKYNTKVLEMPFPLLYKVCLTLDIPRADGNDFRMLAYRLGICVPGDLAFLKQAAITQPPDNNYFNNSTSYVVLIKKSSLAVRSFVDIMVEIERDDIIQLINNWSN